MFTTRGDYILTENYTFCSAIETASPLGLKCVGIAMDSEGIIPSVLDSTLEKWDPSVHDNAEKPWLLYTIPTGQNPTGATQSEHRRREIYRVAQKHDLYIIEDEPYYYLQMPPYTGPLVPTAPRPSSHEEFLSQLVPSYGTWFCCSIKFIQSGNTHSKFVNSKHGHRWPGHAPRDVLKGNRPWYTDRLDCGLGADCREVREAF